MSCPSAGRIGAFAVFCCASLLVTSSSVRAEPTSASNWAVAVGVGVDLYPDLGAIGVGGLAGGLAPVMEARFEGRVAESVWLGLGAEASVSTQELGGSGGGGPHHSAVSAGGSLSARYVFNPGDVVEVSGVTTVGYGYSTAKSEAELEVDGEPTPVTSRVTSHGISAKVGLALGFALTEALQLSVASTLAEAAWDWNRSEAFGVATTAEAFSGGLALRPSLGLRYAF